MDIPVDYSWFKKELICHTNKIDPLLQSVIANGDDTKAIAEIGRKYVVNLPAPRNAALSNPVEVAKDQVHYNMELWEYKSRKTEQIKTENKF